MVSQQRETPTFEARIEAQRKRDIERALAAGNLEMAEFLKTVEYVEAAPEDVEVIERYLDDVKNGVQFEEPDTYLEEWRAEEPEFVAMLERCDERFPGWSKLQFRLPEDHPEDLETLRLLEEHEPEAAAMIREDHEALRRL